MGGHRGNDQPRRKSLLLSLLSYRPKMRGCLRLSGSYPQGSPHFTQLNQAVVLRRGKQATFGADFSDRLAKRRQDDGQPRRKRPATPQVAATQPTVFPAKNEGKLEVVIHRQRL